MKYTLLHEDDHLIVVNKPAGLLVIPTPKNETHTLTDLLNRELDARGIAANAHPCHRLDRETSGVVVFAKGKKAQQAVMEEFRARRVGKRYIAFVHGRVPHRKGMITKPLYHSNKKRLEEAVTVYKVLEQRKDFAVVEVVPKTGRRNQIRLHFVEIGHPLVGESVHAFRKDHRLRFKRLALHARSLEMRHPWTHRQMRFETDLPADMLEFLEREGASIFVNKHKDPA